MLINFNVVGHNSCFKGFGSKVEEINTMSKKTRDFGLLNAIGKNSLPVV